MSTQSATVALFPSVLSRSRVADFDAQAADLLNEASAIRDSIENGPHGAWACPLYSTLMTEDALHRRPAFKRLHDMFLAEARAMAEYKDVDLARQDMVIDRCWLNIVGPGQSMDVHAHANSIYTGVCVLKADAKGPRLMLFHPAKEMGLSLPVTQETPFNEEARYLQPDAGDLYLFDSHLVQSMQVNSGDGDHIHLGFTVAARARNAA